MFTPPKTSFGVMSEIEPAPVRPQVELRQRPVHDARLLTARGHDAEIVLDGQRYLLRITRQGKLILTK